MSASEKNTLADIHNLGLFARLKEAGIETRTARALRGGNVLFSSVGVRHFDLRVVVIVPVGMKDQGTGVFVWISGWLETGGTEERRADTENAE